MDKKCVQVVGVASGNGAGDMGCADGPVVLSESKLLKQSSVSLVWRTMLQPSSIVQGLDGIPIIADICGRLADDIKEIVTEGDMFLALGGDQSCSTGTWSGASVAKSDSGDFGLIWIDAHMDAHTPETSESGNPHGMPLATLLGYGDQRLTSILTKNNKLKPENVCLVGIRSFEQGEADLIERLGVKTFYMPEINARGIQSVLAEAHDTVTRTSTCFGISVDMDGIDPKSAPGVGTPEENGIIADQLIEALHECCHDQRFVGAEIVEFNPHQDKQQKTEILITKIIQALFNKVS